MLFESGPSSPHQQHDWHLLVQKGSGGVFVKLGRGQWVEVWWGGGTLREPEDGKVQMWSGAAPLAPPSFL